MTNTGISYQYLVDPADVRKALADFADQPIIGLDTETFWDFRTRQNHLSLVQLAAPNGAVIVIDALAAGLEESRALIENPEALMAAHNARFDEGILRQSGFAVAGLVDTLRLARRALRLRSFSLASVADHLFGLALDKAHQRSDWRRRPLSREQLDYAALDAIAAMRVFQELTSQLALEGRLDSELQLARLEPPDLQAEPSASGRRGSRSRSSVKRPPIEIRPLTAEENRLVERLRIWRREMAERERIPTYLICPDKTFEHLAVTHPRTLADLTQIFGLGPSKIAKYGSDLLTQLGSRD